MYQEQQWRDILLELMLSIGHELDIDKQLKKFLPTLLRKLGCKAVGVFTTDPIFLQEYALVKELPRNADMSKLSKLLEEKKSHNGQIIHSDESGNIYAYSLTGFGVLCIKHSMLPEIFKNEMRQLCDHLSYNLIACQRHQHLLQTQQELDRFFELSDNLMCIISPRGYFIKVNPTFLTKFELSLDELYTTPFLEFLHTDDQALTEKNTINLNKQTHRTTFNNRFKDKNGNYLNLAWDVARDSISGNIYATAMDITKQVEIESNLNKAKIHAEKAAADRSSFIANMSHEIRTPLNGVLGILDLVVQQPIDKKIKQQLDTAISSGENLLAVVNDILDFSKISSGKLTIEDIDFDLRKLIIDLVAGFEYLAKRKKIELILNHQLDRPIWLKGDPYRVKQILNNLLSNALKFTHHGYVELCVNTINTHGRVLSTFKIKDTGIGLDVAHKNNLFDAFSQADISTTRHYGGTGLGLTICKELVTLMEGSIEIESELQVGTTFSVSIDFHEGKKQNDEKSQKPAKLTPSLKGVCLLLVEDNEVNRIIAKTILHSFGCTVQEAHNGLEAIQVLKQTKANVFSAVIMDCLMPEMDGYEATFNIRNGNAGAHWQSIPILALTANAMAEDQQRCLKAGMDDYLSKPFKRDDLLNHITKLIKTNDN